MKLLAFGSLILAGLLAVGSQVRAADAVTVDSLLAEGYSVVGAVTSPIGPGVFLQKGASLQLCFISETPSSTAITTRYCKPVH